MSGHCDIPDEIVKRAQLYDAEHFRADRAGVRGGSWGSVPPDQVRRLLWGAYGGIPATVEAVHDAIREGLAAAERGETVDLGSFAQYAGEEEA